MGLDTAYIPVKEQDIDFYINDVIQQPELVAQRINQLTPADDNRDFLRAHAYETLLSLTEEQAFDKYLGFSASIVLAYLRPYYYERGMSLFNLAYENGEVSQSLLELYDDFRDSFPNVASGAESGDVNYRSGVYVRAENIAALLEQLNQESIRNRYDLNEQSGLIAALNYAQKHQTGLLETFDIFVPISGEHFSSQYNLRAHFLNNLNDESIENDCDYTQFTIGIPAPSSSEISLDELGSLVSEWVQSEHALPRFEHDSEPDTERGLAGEVRISMIVPELSPLVMVCPTENVFIKDTPAYLDKLNTSLAAFFAHKKVEVNFFISAHGKDEIPEEIRSSGQAKCLYSRETSFLTKTHTMSFMLEESQLELKLGLSGRMQVFVNQEKVDDYKMNTKDHQRTVFITGGQWYTVRTKVLNIFTGEIDIQICHGISEIARFHRKLGADIYPVKTNMLLKGAEWLLIIMGGLFYSFPKPYTLVPLLLLLLLNIKFNKRHHYVLCPMHSREDHNSPPPPEA